MGSGPKEKLWAVVPEKKLFEALGIIRFLCAGPLLLTSQPENFHPVGGVSEH